jgi:hypothetical protein
MFQVKKQGMKGVNHLSKTKNGIELAMKKYVKIEHTNIVKMYFNEIAIHHTFTMNPTKKQLSKNWKVVTLGSIHSFLVILHPTRK